MYVCMYVCMYLIDDSFPFSNQYGPRSCPTALRRELSFSSLVSFWLLLRLCSCWIPDAGPLLIDTSLLQQGACLSLRKKKFSLLQQETMSSSGTEDIPYPGVLKNDARGEDPACAWIPSWELCIWCGVLKCSFRSGHIPPEDLSSETLVPTLY